MLQLRNLLLVVLLTSCIGKKPSTAQTTTPTTPATTSTPTASTTTTSQPKNTSNSDKFYIITVPHPHIVLGYKDVGKDGNNDVLDFLKYSEDVKTRSLDAALRKPTPWSLVQWFDADGLVISAPTGSANVVLKNKDGGSVVAIDRAISLLNFVMEKDCGIVFPQDPPPDITPTSKTTTPSSGTSSTAPAVTSTSTTKTTSTLKTVLAESIKITDGAFMIAPNGGVGTQNLYAENAYINMLQGYGINIAGGISDLNYKEAPNGKITFGQNSLITLKSTKILGNSLEQTGDILVSKAHISLMAASTVAGASNSVIYHWKSGKIQATQDLGIFPMLKIDGKFHMEENAVLDIPLADFTQTSDTSYSFVELNNPAVSASMSPNSLSPGDTPVVLGKIQVTPLNILKTNQTYRIIKSNVLFDSALDKSLDTRLQDNSRVIQGKKVSLKLNEGSAGKAPRTELLLLVGGANTGLSLGADNAITGGLSLKTKQFLNQKFVSGFYSNIETTKVYDVTNKSYLLGWGLTSQNYTIDINGIFGQNNARITKDMNDSFYSFQGSALGGVFVIKNPICSVLLSAGGSLFQAAENVTGDAVFLISPEISSRFVFSPCKEIEFCFCGIALTEGFGMGGNLKLDINEMGLEAEFSQKDCFVSFFIKK